LNANAKPRETTKLQRSLEPKDKEAAKVSQIKGKDSRM